MSRDDKPSGSGGPLALNTVVRLDAELERASTEDCEPLAASRQQYPEPESLDKQMIHQRMNYIPPRMSKLAIERVGPIQSGTRWAPTQLLFAFEPNPHPATSTDPPCTTRPKWVPGRQRGPPTDAKLGMVPYGTDV